MPRELNRILRSFGRLAPTARPLPASILLAAGIAGIGRAAEPAGLPLVEHLTVDEIAVLSALIGVVSFAVLSAIALIRSRTRTEAENQRLRSEIADRKTAAERAEALIAVGSDRIVAWEGPGAPPLVAGNLPPIRGVPEDRAGFLAFGTWLAPASAAQFDRAIGRLRERGESFAMVLTTQAGHYLEAAGRTVGSRAVVRLRDLTGDRLALAALESRYQEAAAALDALQAVVDAAGTPAWIRDQAGHNAWVSQAYAEAVEAGSALLAVERQLAFLDSPARAAIASAHDASPETPFRRRLAAVVAGDRRIFDVVDVALATGGAGIAIDASELEAARAALKRLGDFHARTLDQLATAVAVFGPDRRLRSANAAYRALFGLDDGFIASAPEESEILDRLRAARKLPEQADYRSWRSDYLAAYQAIEARDQLWYLPDGQKLRMIVSPHPEGGLTRIFENVTERMDLETRFNALIQVQRETIDNLSEAVAVFGSDGRLRLHNPSLARIWRVDPALLAARPHVSDLVAACRRLHDEPEAWRRLTACIAGFDETRSSLSGRMERADGRVIDYATVPLPDGLTMVTFVDVTDTVQVERALTERNEALEAADGLKTAFIHHVSYELRSPLTNIIGFTQLLTDPKVGPLNPKQREYTDYIMTSSAALLTIINDILDLATVDAGIMELDLGEVDVERTVEAVVEGLRDRTQESQIALETHVEPGIGSLIGDEKRVRQILFNVLANAIAFSFRGGKVVLGVRRRDGMIEFTVEDNGSGMPQSFVPSAFERFESRPGSSHRRGAGLGLSIVKSFVELHGGTVGLRSVEGEGTTVTIRLPLRPQPVSEAAE